MALRFLYTSESAVFLINPACSPEAAAGKEAIHHLHRFPAQPTARESPG